MNIEGLSNLLKPVRGGPATLSAAPVPRHETDYCRLLGVFGLLALFLGLGFFLGATGSGGRAATADLVQQRVERGNGGRIRADFAVLAGPAFLLLRRRVDLDLL